jgi:hypothetical protein
VATAQPADAITTIAQTAVWPRMTQSPTALPLAKAKYHHWLAQNRAVAQLYRRVDMKRC